MAERRGGYRQQDGYEHDSLPGVDELCDWLEAHQPTGYRPGIVHGDIHLNNTMLRRQRPEVAAFVDWEMCTVGDPLLDLGWMLVCWPIEPNPWARPVTWPNSADWPPVPSSAGLPRRGRAAGRPPRLVPGAGVRSSAS